MGKNMLLLNENNQLQKHSLYHRVRQQCPGVTLPLLVVPISRDAGKGSNTLCNEPGDSRVALCPTPLTSHYTAMHLFIWLVLALVPFSSCYKSTDLSVLDFSTAGPQKGSNLTNLQRDLPEGGQLSTTERKLLNLQTYLGEWLEQTSLFPLIQRNFWKWLVGTQSCRVKYNVRDSTHLVATRSDEIATAEV